MANPTPTPAANPPKKKNPLLIVVVVAALAAGGYFGYKQLSKPEPVMDISYGTGPATGAGSGTPGAQTTARNRVNLDSVYAKAQLDFVGSNKVIKELANAPASEVIEELNEFGLTREELITTIANLLKRIDDDLQAKNMVTTYIASLNIKLTGNEFIKLLQAADISDDFYYSSVIKSTAEFIRYPLDNNQINVILEPIGDFDSRIRSATNLEKERMRAQGKYFD